MSVAENAGLASALQAGGFGCPCPESWLYPVDPIR
jgi:hypothetical protein